MKRSQLSKGNRLATVGAFGVFLALLAFGEYICQTEAAREQGSVQNRVLLAASTIRARLEADLNSTIYLGVGLSGYLSLDPTIDPDTLPGLLGTIAKQGRHVRNIGLAPDNRLDYIYPLEGNEEALGMAYADNPSQWPAVQQAMETKETVIVGPIELIQGGYGIITRTPVFLRDGSYWGIISVVVDLESLLDHAAATMGDRVRAQWAMRAMASTSQGEPFVYGNPTLFEQGGARQTIDLPGATWEIVVAPDAAWAFDELRIAILRFLSVLCAATVAILVFLTLAERAQIKHLALHDVLTGLPNRRLLLERIEQRITLGERYKTGFSLLYIDLNKFKPVNDQFGHHAGDHVLRETAERIRRALRTSDTVARTGGDEFVVLLPDTDGQDAAQTVANNLEKIISEPIAWNRHELRVGASIGISRYPDHGTTFDALTDYADKDMYTRKRARHARDGSPLPSR